MKKLNIILLLIGYCIIATPRFAAANDGKFEEAMKKNIDAVYKAQSIDEYRQAINAFERIGASEKKRWEPQYYAAFGYIMLSMRETEKDKKDQVGINGNLRKRGGEAE